MALIKCPECGRENVSDSAESCPQCGFGIKLHVDKIKRESMIKKMNQERLDSIVMPSKPKRKKLNIIIWAAILCWAVCGFYGFYSTYTYSLELALGVLLFGCGFSVFLYYVIVLKDYNEAMKVYQRAKNDFEQYKRDELAAQYKRQMEQNNIPKCPICGSSNIKKITLSARAAKTAAFGVVGAVDDAGKNWKCSNCGSKF